MSEEEAKELTEAASAERTDAAEASSDRVDLLRGAALTGLEVEWLATSHPIRLAVLAGASDSGKTTLVASMYERFQRGPYAGLSFAGSLTLPAFEERCELARASSGRSKPDTPHTPRQEGFHFLHLRVRSTGSAGRRQDVLLADITGEMYKEAKDNAEACRRLHLVRRAHVLALLVDGASMAAPATRHSSFEEARRLLRRFLEEHMIGNTTKVELIYSKWDEVLTSETDGLDEARAVFEQYLGEHVRPHVASLDLHLTAASPKKKPDMGVGWGVDSILRAIATPSRLPRFELCGFDAHVARDYLTFGRERDPRVGLWHKPV